MDFELVDGGSLVGITPLTDAATDWIDENVASEGWQWMGRTLYVDARYAEPLVNGMIGDGLTCEGAC